MNAIKQQETVANEVGTAVRHSAVYGLGAISAKVLGFLMLPVYTRYLNPSDYGVLEILDLSMSLIGMFLNMGMTAAILRYYNDAAGVQEKRNVISTAFQFVAASGLLVLCLVLPFVHQISALVLGANVASKYFLLSFLSFILGYIANVPRTYLRAIEASGRFVLLDTAGLFVALILNIVFIVGLKAGLVGILMSALVVNVAWLPASVWVVRRVGMVFNWPVLRSMAIFGFPLIFSNLALFGLNFSDRFFLQRFRSLDVVGVYAIGYKFAYMLNYLVVQPFNVMWQSRMYVIHANPDHPKIFDQMFVLYSILLIYAGLALSLGSSEIVELMVGPKFSASQTVIPIVTLAYIFCGISCYAQLGMMITKKTSAIGKISVIAACLNLGLNYFLISRYGMEGAAWATMLSFLAIAVGSYWFSQRLLPLPLGVGRVATALGFALVLYLSSRAWISQPLMMTLLLKAFLLTIFPLVMWKSGILSRAEINTLNAGKDRLVSGVSRLVGWESRKAVRP